MNINNEYMIYNISYIIYSPGDAKYNGQDITEALKI